jgi:hypothetical protein
VDVVKQPNIRLTNDDLSPSPLLALATHTTTRRDPDDLPGSDLNHPPPTSVLAAMMPLAKETEVAVAGQPAVNVVVGMVDVADHARAVHPGAWHRRSRAMIQRRNFIPGNRRIGSHSAGGRGSRIRSCRHAGVDQTSDSADVSASLPT